MDTLLSRDDLAAIAVRSIEIMAAGELADFRKVIHPEAVNREAVSEPPASRGVGPEAFHATALWLRSAFSDIAFSVEETVVEGDLVVTHGQMSGRQTGSFVVWNATGGVERVFVPTGRSFAVNHAHFFRLRDGQVVEHWAVRDDNALGLQLGWVPPSPAFLLRCALATARARRLADRA